jgi:hypothetical protein
VRYIGESRKSVREAVKVTIALGLIMNASCADAADEKTSKREGEIKKG